MNRGDTREAATFAMRLVALAVAVALVGVFFLPWIHVDGFANPSSGVELIAIAASPMLGYLLDASEIQAYVLVGGPALALGSSILIAWNYRKRRPAPVETFVVLAVSIGMVYGAPDLTGGDGAYIGLRLVSALSAVLLIHWALIRANGRLLRKGKYRDAYAAISVATGSGYYRWRDT